MNHPTAPVASLGYQVFMLVLCLYAVGALTIQAVMGLEPEIKRVLVYADYAISALFLLDFLICLNRAPSRWRYFITWGWLDLLSSIPMLQVTRWGRLERVVRLCRVLRAIRTVKLFVALALEQRAQNTFLAASLVGLLVIVFSSVALLHFEASEHSNIRTAEDAIWWALATITTVDSGDHFPVTPEGRFIAGILMCVGVGLFGTLSAFLASWFLGAKEHPSRNDIAALRAEIASLRELLERRAATGTALESPQWTGE